MCSRRAALDEVWSLHVIHQVGQVIRRIKRLQYHYFVIYIPVHGSGVDVPVWNVTKIIICYMLLARKLPFQVNNRLWILKFAHRFSEIWTDNKVIKFIRGVKFEEIPHIFQVVLHLQKESVFGKRHIFAKCNVFGCKTKKFP